jgi:hypothetical protein
MDYITRELDSQHILEDLWRKAVPTSFAFIGKSLLEAMLSHCRIQIKMQAGKRIAAPLVFHKSQNPGREDVFLESPWIAAIPRCVSQP